jgi:hypothetical protein
MVGEGPGKGPQPTQTPWSESTSIGFVRSIGTSDKGEVLDAALRYAANDWPVFPLVANTKAPATEHGFKDATTSASRIHEWYCNAHHYNLGIRTGSGVVVIDVDVKNGNDGFSTLEKLSAEIGVLPDTKCVITPSGGRHFYFTVSETLPCSVGELGIGVDVRADGGYVVAPPSSIEGVRYRWEDPLPMMPLPAAWVLRIKKKLHTDDFHEHDGKPVPIGQQEEVLNKRACSLRRHGVLSRIATVEALWAEAQAWEQDPQRRPWNRADVAYKVDRAWRDIEPGDNTGVNSHSSPLSQPAWPKGPDAEVFRGLAGDVVATLREHTEADDVALLSSFLLVMSTAIGVGPYVAVGEARHGVNLFAVTVGATSRSRKGHSWDSVRQLILDADPTMATQIVTGLSTGEGLIERHRDDVEVREWSRKEKRFETHIDSGRTDKRLLAVETEMGRTLEVARREGNTLSHVMCQAYDRAPLDVLTRQNPIRATGHHINVLGHITVIELRARLDDVSVANGYANRFLWLPIRRARWLSRPEPVGDADREQLVQRMADVLATARTRGRMDFDPDGGAAWDDAYPILTEDRTGLLGAMTARAEAHAIRLALLYALLDVDFAIRRHHVESALALVAYAGRGVTHLFGDRLGDPIADTILATVRRRSKGECRGRLNRTEASLLFGGHAKSRQLDAAVAELVAGGVITVEEERTDGRSITWLVDAS